MYWRTALFLNNEQKYFEQQEYDIEKYAELAEQNKVSFDYVNFLRTQYENEAGKRTGLEMAQEQYEFLDRQQFAGKEVKFLSYKGYRQLFDNERADILDAVKMILVIVLGICNLFSYEKNTNVQLLIACAPEGEYRVNKCKCLVSFLYVCMAWAVSFLTRLILIGTGYGYSHLLWSSAGLKCFFYLPTVIPIWIAMVLIQLLRIGGGMLAVALTAFLSSRVSIVPVTIIISIIILVFPVITYFSGFTRSWGILSLVSGHIMIMK